MAFTGPSKITSNEELIPLIFNNAALEQQFWDYFDPKAAEEVRVGYPEPPRWASVYPIPDKLKTIFAQAEFIGIFCHALGLMESFYTDPLRNITPVINEVFLARYPNTISSLITKLSPNCDFAAGYYNTAFQASLLRVLKAFHKWTPDPIKVLPLAIDVVRNSLEHPSTKEIHHDLMQGITRIFSTGREIPDDFHATTIVMSKRYIAFCDRFDVNPLISIADKPLKTHRDHQHGVYVYQLPCTFSQLSEKIQKHLMKFLTQSLSREDAMIGIQKLLGLSDEPFLCLPAKKQKRGNCRYASKKQGIAGTMLLVAIEEAEKEKLSAEGIQLIKKEITRLQKIFKLFDRAYQIDALIAHKEMNDAQKEQLLLSALFRMKSKNKKRLIDRIVNYFKVKAAHSPQISIRLYYLFDKLSQKLVPDDYTQYINPIKKLLQDNGVKIFAKKQPSQYMPLYQSKQKRSVPYDKAKHRSIAAKESSLDVQTSAKKLVIQSSAS